MSASPAPLTASPVLGPETDVEKTQVPPVEEKFVRPVSKGTWILVCAGLYLGALLYGKFVDDTDLPVDANTNS